MERIENSNRGAISNQILEDGQGECDKDSGLKLGLNVDKEAVGKLDGVNNLEGRQINKDFCYDPNVKSQGPLVPLESCKTFEANSSQMDTKSFDRSSH